MSSSETRGPMLSPLSNVFMQSFLPMKWRRVMLVVDDDDDVMIDALAK